MTAITACTISDYAAAAREALSDLSPDQAHAVLDGLGEHLAEIASEGTDDLEVALARVSLGSTILITTGPRPSPATFATVPVISVASASVPATAVTSIAAMSTATSVDPAASLAPTTSTSVP